MKDQLTVRTKNTALLTDLYGNTPSTADETVVDDAIHIEFVSNTEVGKGFGSSEIAINIIISVLTGVASGVVANILYDKIMQKGRNQIIIKEKRLTITTKEELIEYIETSRTIEK